MDIGYGDTYRFPRFILSAVWWFSLGWFAHAVWMLEATK